MVDNHHQGQSHGSSSTSSSSGELDGRPPKGRASKRTRRARSSSSSTLGLPATDGGNGSSRSSSTSKDLSDRCTSLATEIEALWVPCIDSQGGLDEDQTQAVRRLMKVGSSSSSSSSSSTSCCGWLGGPVSSCFPSWPILLLLLLKTCHCILSGGHTA